MLNLPDWKKNGSNLLPLLFMIPSACDVYFFRMCEEAIRPKLTFSKHDEPGDNKIKDENKVPATKPLISIIEKYRLVADSLPHENKKKVEFIPVSLILTTLCLEICISVSYLITTLSEIAVAKLSIL